MPSLYEHQSNLITKMLLIGDSGSGKTGSLASLADAGYNLYILDLDNGLDAFKNMLLDPKSPYKNDPASRIRFQTITDKMKPKGGKLIPADPTSWKRTINAMEKWETPEDGDRGGIFSWGEKDVLVIDSLTFLSRAALRFQLGLNGRLNSPPQLQDWGAAQELIRSLVETLYDDNVKCNVIVISHIDFISADEQSTGVAHGYPASIGKKLSPQLARYFNTVLMMKTQGSKRKLHTSTMGLVELKNAAPLRVKKDYDITFGLAEYFADVRDGTKGKSEAEEALEAQG